MPVENQSFFEDDGLQLPMVGPWTRAKHSKIAYYSSLFSNSMKRKWNCRIYLDLFSGAGKARIRGTNRVIPGSPLLALSVDVPFDKYVFCEQDSGNLDALQRRVNQCFSERDVFYVSGDINISLDKLFTAIPTFSKSYKGITLCFVDPFKMGALDFRTLETISERLFVDFLVLIPSYMDIHRNERVYTRKDNSSLDKYLGSSSWRSRWSDPGRIEKHFGLFIAKEFCQRMKDLGFIYEDPEDMELVRMKEGKNLPLYHLAFFSKSRLGLKFWRDTRKNTTKQLRLL